MQRRKLLKTWLIGLAVFPAAKVEAKPIRKKMILQTSPVAGVQYYQVDNVWTRLSVGQQVLLQAEIGNQYDADAVEIYWQDQTTDERYKLGYLPRKQNYAVSQLLQNQKILCAEISQLKKSNDPWQKIAITIFMKG
ncbi:HIRAN domain-containing protein [Thiomicrorhabdus sp.]|uniref:HIRAN domain-containing protein n=1 Tax=Thiomicrorhabdus sp. TaxID=2039724 RepID=UPI0029C8500B|nr:HIRAN domain-containing protein [Thiomicrorhabdus sp.]